MALRIVVLGAGHWHGAFDAAYLRLFARMPAVEVVGVHDDARRWLRTGRASLALPHIPMHGK